jgi:hypothetical protein
MPEFGKPDGISLELFVTREMVGAPAPPPPPPPVAPKVVNCSVMEDPIAVTRTLAVCPALFVTATIVPIGRLLLGMGADDAIPGVPNITARVPWVKPENVDAPVNPGRIAAFAAPCGVRLLPFQRMSPPEEAVTSVSRFSDWVAVRVLVSLTSAKVAMGKARARAVQPIRVNSLYFMIGILLIRIKRNARKWLS